MEGAGAITDAPVLDLAKTCLADTPHDFVDRTQSESVAREGHFGHLVRFANPEYQSPAWPQHSDQLPQSYGEVRHEINSVRRNDRVQCGVFERQTLHPTGVQP